MIVCTSYEEQGWRVLWLVWLVTSRARANNVAGVLLEMGRSAFWAHITIIRLNGSHKVRLITDIE
jgi:hypothetical protein